MDRAEEIELAEQLLKGDEHAFERFAEHFYRKIFHYTWLMCGQREDAEEVAQETMLSAFQNFQSLKSPSQVRPWVFQIARNACLMKRRRSIFAPSPQQELSLDAVMPNKQEKGGSIRLEIADWSQLPEHEAEASEMRRLLESALQELPPHYRSIVMLRDLEELSVKETAETMAISEDAVKQRLHRGRLALRKNLERHLKGAQTAHV